MHRAVGRVKDPRAKHALLSTIRICHLQNCGWRAWLSVSMLAAAVQDTSALVIRSRKLRFSRGLFCLVNVMAFRSIGINKPSDAEVSINVLCSCLAWKLRVTNRISSISYHKRRIDQTECAVRLKPQALHCRTQTAHRVVLPDKVLYTRLSSGTADSKIKDPPGGSSGLSKVPLF